VTIAIELDVPFDVVKECYAGAADALAGNLEHDRSEQEMKMPKLFVKDSTYETPAIQAYMIMIGRVMNQQTIHYGQMCDVMEYRKSGSVLSYPLSKIMNLCEKEGLPALTSIVVDIVTGIPSYGLTTVKGHNFAKEQQLVYAVDWYSIIPPTIEELKSL
jgi:hypothetical protein